MRGTIEQRSPGTWSLRFDLGVGADGKRKQKRVTVKGNKKHAQAELNRILHELQTGEFTDASRMTVAQYLERWLKDYARTNVSAKTYERYAEIVRKHLIPALGRIQLAQLKPLQIQGYYTEALESGRRDGRGGLSAQTVLHHHRILKQSLRQAVRWQLLVRNPADAVQPPVPEEKEMQVLTPDEAAELFRNIEGHRFFVPLLFHLSTGLRRGEVLALRWQDVTLRWSEAQGCWGGVAAVKQSLEETDEFGLRFKQPKTKKSKRPVVLPSLLAEALVRHKGEQAQARLLVGAAWKDLDLVFPDPLGNPIVPETFSKAWYELVRRYPKIKRIRLHDLRHTHATHLLLEGVHPKIVSERLGHANIGITMDTYSHVIPGLQEGAAQQIDATLRAAMGKARNTRDEPLSGAS